MSKRFEPLHAALTFTGGPMGVLTAVIEIAALTMCHARQHLALGRSVALELIGDEHARHVV
jgi:hypothetical protein